MVPIRMSYSLPRRRAPAPTLVKLPVELSGIPPLAHIGFKVKDPVAVRTLFTQLMLDRGYLAKDAFYAMFAHSDADVDGFTAACAEAFEHLAWALREDRVVAELRGPVGHSGFKRLT